MRRFKRWLGFLLLLNALWGIAQPPANPIVNFRLLGIADGLSVREVLCAVQDDRGFIWFGTDVGLNKYDGENFTLFNAGNCKMQSDRIGNLAKDEQGMLWIFYSSAFSGFSRGTVDILDPESNALNSFSERFKNAPFPETSISYISGSINGAVYISLANGDCYLCANGIFTKKGSSNEKEGAANWRVVYPGQLWIDHLVSAEYEKALSAGNRFQEGPRNYVLQVGEDGQTVMIKLTGTQHWFVIDARGALQPTSINMSGIDDSKLFSGDAQVVRSPLCRAALIYSANNGIYLFDDNR